MDTYNSFSELPGAGGNPTQSEMSIFNMSTWNMGTVKEFRGVRGARKGLKLVVGSRDHGNPHVEAWAGDTPLAKIFIETETIKDSTAVAFDPSRGNFLNKAEKALIFEYLSDDANLEQCKVEWNRAHAANASAQRATLKESQNETET